MSELSPSEKKGLLIISALILVGFIIQLLQPQFVKKDLYDYSVQDSIFKILSSDSSKVNEDSSSNQEIDTNNIKTSKKEKSVTNLINVNTASQKELETLPRIGPVTAQNILKYRKENGPFKDLKDLRKVKRIGPKTIKLLEPYITFSGQNK